MAETDLIKLYSKELLALAAGLDKRVTLDAPDATGRARSPRCGSVVSVELSLDGDRIGQFGQNVKACALGQASAALFVPMAAGLTRADVAEGRDAVAGILAGQAVSEGRWARFDVLRAAQDFENRHASILLIFDATLAAFDAAA